MPVKTISEKEWETLSPRRSSPKDRLLQEYIEALADGKIVQVSPEANMTIRGMKASLSRRAAAAGFQVEYRDMKEGFAARRR